VAVGDSGTIVRSNDGGETWTQQCSGTTDNLAGVSFVDAQTGWAVGGYAEFITGRITQAIVHTTDGGQTWARRDSPTDNVFHAVSFVDTNTGIAVGDYGTIMRTDTGGE
jgi:photosystem II stability/assembly factor-like uncharacterized protein